jgi:hypothetical protein
MIFLEQIKEDSILDSLKVRKELNPELFDTDGGNRYVLDEGIRKTLLHIADKFYSFLGIKFFIHDLILTGSLANYNWSQYSDVDLHIVIDFGESPHDYTLLKEFFDAKKVIWNSQHSIKIKGYNVELYVQDMNEVHDSTGVYSVLNDKWVVEPQKHKVKIDKKQIKEKVEQWMETIDDLVAHKDDEAILPRVEKVRQRLKKFRQAGLDAGGEFSYENLVFKYLRRDDYIKKLLDLKNEIIDRELSLNQ